MAKKKVSDVLAIVSVALLVILFIIILVWLLKNVP